MLDLSKPVEFAKIFLVEGHQVLFWIENDSEADEDDRMKLHQIVKIDGFCADISLGGIIDTKAEKMFGGLSQEDAVSVFEMVKTLLGANDRTADQE